MKFQSAFSIGRRHSKPRFFISIGAALILAGCGKAESEKLSPGTGDAGPAATIAVGQQVSYEAGATPLSRKAGDYAFGNTTKYVLTVTEQMTVAYSESMASTACLDPLEADGPFVTLISADASVVSNDKVAHGDAAVSSIDIRKELAPGNYEVQVTFYATGETCGANLDFMFEKKDSGTPAVQPGPGPGPNPNPGLTPSPAFDGELVGSWMYVESDSGFSVSHQLTIKDDQTVVQVIRVNDDVYLDHDLTILPQTETSQKRIKLRVDNVRVDITDEPTPAGTEIACIYQLVNTQLNLNCGESADSYPGDFGDGTVFSKGTAPNPTPLPNPDGGELVKEYTNLSVAIPDDSLTGVSFPIEVTEDVNIKDLTLKVNITHPWVGDLRIRLQHPNGTIVLVRSPSGGSQNDLSLTYGTGFTAPDGDFTQFSELPAKGTWKLIVSDESSSDIGLLTAVTLKIQH